MSFIRKYWVFILLFLAGVVLTFVISSYLSVQRDQRFVYAIDDPELSILSEDIQVGIVFGGGVRDSGPSPVVRDRLNTAAELLERGYVDKLILSGDNRSITYNEPQVMYEYLLSIGVPAEDLQRDFAGRSTYETCERANKIFGVNKALLVSQESHLARAVFLCRKFGIESYGVQSSGRASNSGFSYQQIREVFASAKAVFNVYIIGENTILGEQIDLMLNQEAENSQ